jgi:hypothetical protein
MNAYYARSNKFFKAQDGITVKDYTSQNKATPIKRQLFFAWSGLLQNAHNY